VVVKDKPYDSEAFDHFVGVLVSRLEQVAEVAAEWPNLDDEERLAYVEDWPVNESLRWKVEDYARRHTLAPRQRAEYQRLKRLEEERWPTLLRLGVRVPPLTAGAPPKTAY